MRVHLLQHEPSLAPHALLATLAVGYTHLYGVLRAPPYNLVLDEATARTLLEEPAAILGAPSQAGESEQPEAPSRWQELVLHGPWPLVLDLMREQPVLRQAALSTTLVVEAMLTPLMSTIALQLVQMGANLPSELGTMLLALPCPAPRWMLPSAEARESLREAVVVRGLQASHARAEVLGFYRRSHEEVTRAGLSAVLAGAVAGGVAGGGQDASEERRRLYRKVGSDLVLWFRVLDEEEVETGEAEGAGGMEAARSTGEALAGAGAGEAMEEDEEDEGDEQEEGDEEDEGEKEEGEEGSGMGGGQGDDKDDKDAAWEREEPEEQVGTWVITSTDALLKAARGQRLSPEEVLVRVEDNAMTPNKVGQAWSVLAKFGKYEPANELFVSSVEASGWYTNGSAVDENERGIEPGERRASGVDPLGAAKDHLLSRLMQVTACAPLVRALLERVPTLRTAAMLAALEAPGVQVYRRFTEESILEVDEEVVDALLERTKPNRAGKHLPNLELGKHLPNLELLKTRWGQLLLSLKTKRPLIESLLAAHQRLRHATLHPSLLAAALRPSSRELALWLLVEKNVPVDAGVLEALTSDNPSVGSEPHELVLTSADAATPLSWCTHFVRRARDLNGKPVFSAASGKDLHVWWLRDGLWLVSLAREMHDRPTITGVSAMLPSHGNLPPLERAMTWQAFEGRDRVDRSVMVHLITPGPSRLHTLVQSAQCAALLEALIVRAPSLAPAALVGSLEVHGAEPYRRLTDGPLRLALDEPAVSLLLQPPPAGPSGSASRYPTRWSCLFRNGCLSVAPLLPPLMKRFPSLAEAARSQVAPAARPAGEGEGEPTLPPYGTEGGAAGSEGGAAGSEEDGGDEGAEEDVMDVDNDFEDFEDFEDDLEDDLEGDDEEDGA